MRKLFTLAVASAMATAALSAQAQVTVDGVLNANELTAGNYVLVGKFTGARGFGDWGLLSLYAATTATKVTFFLGGTVQENGNAFQLFLKTPASAGVPTGTALPFGAAGTSFEKMGAKLDMPTNLAVALRSTTGGFNLEGIAYTNATTAVTTAVLNPTVILGTGAVTTITSTSIAALTGARVAYSNTTDGKVTSNPGYKTPATDAAYGGAGSYGMEFEIDRAAAGMTGTAALQVFAVQNSGDGGYVSSDYIPQKTGALPTGGTFSTTNDNLQANPDFALVPGTQAATLNLTASGVTLSSKGAQEAAALRFGVYPNPASATAVHYTVPQGRQDVALSVYDATGRQVRSLRAAQVGSQSYPLSNLRAGMYVVKLNVGGQQTSGKVVIE